MLSTISEKTFKSTFKNTVRLKPTDISLHDFAGNYVTVLGIADVQVSQSTTLPLVVVKEQGPSLLGCNWLEHIDVSPCVERWQKENHGQSSKSSVTRRVGRVSSLYLSDPQPLDTGVLL